MKRIGYIDGRRVFLANGQALSFGTNKEVLINFDGAQLVIDASGHNIIVAAVQTDIYGAFLAHGGASIAGAITLQTVIIDGACGIAGPLTVAARLVIAGIPVADPHVGNQLWDNAGTVHCSHG